MRHWRKLAALLLALAVLFTLGACGKKKPGPEDAKAYVKAIMDAMCTGEYDQSVEFADIENMEELAKLRESSVDEALESMVESMPISDENRDAFKSLILDAMAKAKYTVKDAVADGDAFNVTVTVEPLNIYSGVEEAISDTVSALMEDPNAGSMSEEDLYDAIMTAMIDAMRATLENPEYGEGQDIVVRYYEMEENLYGVNGEDGEKLGAALFMTE